ncbi:MAG TPA: YoaP domain-containing protein [Bryobacteraceae bacterium]|nr:YoaP domain-containing protein [Bryobacteraceae bacterium]
MTARPVLIDIGRDNIDEAPCCGIKDPAHPGLLSKRCWLKAQCSLGLRAKQLVGPDGKRCGYIEYLPGEFAWRGVNAAGYMFIHCVWNQSRQCQGKGWGSAMIEACLNDARAAGMNGVAAMTRDGPWMAGRTLFVANGFKVADTAAPDCQLLVRKFKGGAADPTFKGGYEEKVARFGRGLTIIRSDQCPYIAKSAAEIAQTAKEEFYIKPKMIELESWSDAQNAPSPYAVFAVIYKGRLLADHQISRTRFRNIMNGVLR